MAIPIKLKGTASEFQMQDFTSTKWATAEDKAKIANKLTRFILGGFEQTAFTKAMYQRLSNMFGHIAHYNLHGFYEVWFADIKACRNWAEHITNSWLAGIGDPQFTWSDFEQVLIQWMKDNRIAEQLNEMYRLDVEQNELKLLQTLQRKYAAPDTILQLNEVIRVPVELPRSKTAETQLSLF
jgi:hypothetical protein